MRLDLRVVLKNSRYKILDKKLTNYKLKTNV